VVQSRTPAGGADAVVGFGGESQPPM
ncbi:uncharacterized protein METZ01_LOCUS314985, partial [marine metagenome]